MKKALIIFGGWEGHKPKETSELVAGDLRAAGFEVELSDKLDTLLDEARLKTFDLIVPNWTMGQLTGEQEKALVAAIESGVGLGGFHAAWVTRFAATAAINSWWAGSSWRIPTTIRITQCRS